MNNNQSCAGVCLLFICLFFWGNLIVKNINIAIDGPAGAGKSTVAKLVAKELGFLYIDTGAMYRALTLQAMELGINLQDEFALNNYLKTHTIQLVNDGGSQKVIVNDREVTEQIRTPEVSRNVSLVSSHAEVRKTMVSLQQELAKGSNVVMDGRDIGTHVLPQAQVKIFLTASIEERAKRRFEELMIKGYKANLNEIIKDISLRDKKDQERAVAPLKAAEDAVLIDTSSLSVQEVVQKILDYVKEKT